MVELKGDRRASPLTLFSLLTIIIILNILPTGRSLATILSTFLFPQPSRHFSKLFFHKIIYHSCSWFLCQFLPQHSSSTASFNSPSPLSICPLSNPVLLLAYSSD